MTGMDGTWSLGYSFPSFVLLLLPSRTPYIPRKHMIVKQVLPLYQLVLSDIFFKFCVATAGGGDEPIKCGAIFPDR